MLLFPDIFLILGISSFKQLRLVLAPIPKASAAMLDNLWYLMIFFKDLSLKMNFKPRLLWLLCRKAMAYRKRQLCTERDCHKNDTFLFSLLYFMTCFPFHLYYTLFFQTNQHKLLKKQHFWKSRALLIKMLFVVERENIMGAFAVN